MRENRGCGAGSSYMAKRAKAASRWKFEQSDIISAATKPEVDLHGVLDVDSSERAAVWDPLGVPQI